MKLNLPIFQNLQASQNILIAGMGGGYDVFCGLPIYYELTQQGKQVHLANLSSHDISSISTGSRLNKHLVGVGKEKTGLQKIFQHKTKQAQSFCELHLANWLQSKEYKHSIVWCFEKTGVKPLKKSYEQLIKKLSIDTIILVDGGVDSLIKGDEQEQGTLLEDLTSLAGVSLLSENIDKYLISIGLGVETDIFYGDILQNMAELTKKGAFYGSCSLTKDMAAYQFYKEALLYTQNHPDQLNSSVINSSIISATDGEYGNYHLTTKTEGSTLWINPLMSIYWCFDLTKVSQWNLLHTVLHNTKSFDDVVKVNETVQHKNYKRENVPHIEFKQSKKNQGRKK